MKKTVKKSAKKVKLFWNGLNPWVKRLLLAVLLLAFMLLCVKIGFMIGLAHGKNVGQAAGYVEGWYAYYGFVI